MAYVHSDHLGSPRKITDASGSVVASNDFYPFGLPAATTGIEGSWFSGYELEHQNTATTSTDDVYFLHARWYFPQLARFLSPDPVRGEVFSPQSFNLFAYVGGNPANLVDPWGLAARRPCLWHSDSDVTVYGKDPCPEAPERMDCATWEELKRFWEEANRRSAATSYDRWSFSGNCGSFAGAVCPTQRNHWVAGQSDPTLVILREVGKLEPVTSGMTMLVSEATVITAGGMAIEAVPAVALKPGAGNLLQLYNPSTGFYSGPTLRGLYYRLAGSKLGFFVGGFTLGFQNGPIPLGPSLRPPALNAGYRVGQVARWLVGW